MPAELTVVLLHAAATWGMVGLIWFVQIVHYPLMRGAAGSDFSRWAESHQRRTTFIVGPLMLAEAVSAAYILVLPDSGSLRSTLAIIGAVLLGVVWMSTFFVQVPLHARLARGFDFVAWKRLVMTNWIRTAGWTARGVVALWFVAEVAR